MKTGGIYLVKFCPGYGEKFKKYRPAIVMSNAIIEIDHRFVLILPFTSNTETKNPKHELVIENEAFEKDVPFDY